MELTEKEIMYVLNDIRETNAAIKDYRMHTERSEIDPETSKLLRIKAKLNKKFGYLMLYTNYKKRNSCYRQRKNIL